MLATAQSEESSRRKKPPMVSTAARGPLSLSEPRKNMSQTDPPKLNLYIPQPGSPIPEDSLAHEILMSYTGSPYHYRPPKEHSLTGLPGLVKRPVDDLTERTLAGYGHRQLVDQAASIHPGQFPEKKTFTLPDFHPMMKYSPHASFMSQRSARGRHAGQHRKALSAPGKYWSPQAADSNTAIRWPSTTCYMRHSLSASGSQYGGWLGISQLRRHPRTGATMAGIEVNPVVSPRVLHSAAPGSELEDSVPEGDEYLGIGQFTNEDFSDELEEAGSLRQKGEVKTGHVLLAPPSLDAVYVHRYHPVTANTFLKGKVASKSPRTIRAKWTLPGKQSKPMRNK